MKAKTPMKLTRIIIVTVIFCLGALIFIRQYLPAYLTANQKINANVLVVEGWIGDEGLASAYQEYVNGNYSSLVVTGSFFQERITIYTNSFLVFYPPRAWETQTEADSLFFAIHASSSLGTRDAARFVFWVEDQPLAGFYTSEHKGKYEVSWESRSRIPDSVMVQFVNDKFDAEGDRNLHLLHLTMNDVNLFKQNEGVFLDRGRPFGKYRWNVTGLSYADVAAHYFIDRGVNPAEVFAVTNRNHRLRRTLGNAIALRHWLDQTNAFPGSINVVSRDYHSRRTWKTYQKVVGQDVQVGVISTKDSQISRSRQKRYQHILRETFALIYYKIFVLPFA